MSHAPGVPGALKLGNLTLGKLKLGMLGDPATARKSGATQHQRDRATHRNCPPDRWRNKYDETYK